MFEQFVNNYLHYSFLVSGGALTFYVVPKDSEVEMEFINKPRHPLRRY